MSNDKVLGGIILIGSIAGIVAYFWLLFFSPWAYITLQLSAFIAVAMILIIMAWIGYTLATTPTPVPLEDLNLEEEVEEPK